MIVRFVRLEENVSVGKGTFNVVHGMKQTQRGEEEYSKRYFADNKMFNSIFRAAQPGDMFKLTYDETTFKNLQGAEKLNGGGGGNPTPHPPSSHATTAPPSSASQVVVSATAPTEEALRIESVSIASDVVMKGMETVDTFKSLMKKGSTFDSILQQIVTLAGGIMDFVTGKTTTEVESDNGDLEEDAPHLEQPEVTG